MKRFGIIAVAIFAVALVFSCKTQQSVATNNNQQKQNATETDPNGSDYVPPTGQRNDPITEKKAIEEATFIDGCIYKLIDNKRAALGEFQEVLNMNPENDAANYEVAGLYHELGQSDRALKYAAEAVRLDPTNTWYKFRYAEILQATHKDAEAIAIYKDLIAADPDNADLKYRLADCQTKAEQYDAALATYSEIEKIIGNSDTLARCRIRMYEAKKDEAGVESTLKGLTASFPNNEKYFYELAKYYEEHAQQDKANGIYRSMAVKFPYSATPHLKLAEIHKVAGQEAEAQKEAMAAFNIPEELDAKIEYLSKWYPIGDTAAALSAAKKKESDSLCSALRRTHKDDARSFTVSGDYLLKGGKSKEARAQYRKAIELSKESYAPWKQLLRLNAENKDDVQQEKDCKEVLELFPTQPDPYFYLGEIQFRRKKYDEAQNNLQTAMDYNLDNPGMDHEIRIMMIDIYRAKGENREADALVERMMKAEPQNMKWKAQLAQSLLDQNKEFYRAEQMMLEVVEKEPNNAEYLALLGWIEFSMGDYKMADEYMSKALAITPNNAKMNERKGDIQFRLKNTDEAVKYWNKAKANGGSSPELEEKIRTRTLKDDY
jgi:tetratricopeptide (TPR) repeat protein